MMAPRTGPATYTQYESKSALIGVGAERARGVHRGTGDRAAPQAGQRDVATDAECADDAQVLGSRRGSEDDADQTERQHRLHHERVARAEARRRVVGPEGRRDVHGGLQEPRGEARTASWATMYPGTRRQGKSPRSENAM